ncbi:MAG: PQQ-binding-like beta-propeller repeat protein [Planctomycetes bacterium]|nr:PQQ-binding-like beta-propeller repeat protein [Planctomycetota bacterium]
MRSPGRCLLASVTFLVLASSISAQDGWMLFGGNPLRNGAAAGLPAFAKRMPWQRPLLLDKLEGFDEPDADQAVKDLIDKLRKDADPTILPGSFPLIVNDWCVYRSYRDVRNAAVREYADKADGLPVNFKPAEIVWKSLPHATCLAGFLEKPQGKNLMPRLADALKANKQEHWLWANPMIGSLSSDGKLIYLVHDLAFPGQPPEKGIVLPNPLPLGDFKPFFMENSLYAYDGRTGKLVWDSYDFSGMKSVFPNTYFLGAPLPQDGKLYVLSEKDADLRLLVGNLDRKKWKSPSQLEFEKTLPLVKIPAGEQVREHTLRRTQPLHIAHADGLLVCPTHAGTLVGVDRVKLEVRWEYVYRDADKTPAPKLPLWQAATPIIHKDRIVFTAADAPEIHCIDLDGKKKWVVPADKDLYLATVHENIVLLVGKTHCRGLALANGAEKWKVELGPPAGVGVKDGAIYYVPLKRDVVLEVPTIWGIDLVKGTKARRVEVPHKDALGNLALHRGMFVSQSATHIAAFPLGADAK